MATGASLKAALCPNRPHHMLLLWMPSEYLIISTGSAHSVKILLAIYQAFAYVSASDYHGMEKAMGIGNNVFWPFGGLNFADPYFPLCRKMNSLNSNVVDSRLQFLGSTWRKKLFMLADCISNSYWNNLIFLLSSQIVLPNSENKMRLLQMWLCVLFRSLLRCHYSQFYKEPFWDDAKWGRVLIGKMVEQGLYLAGMERKEGADVITKLVITKKQLSEHRCKTVGRPQSNSS